LVESGAFGDGRGVRLAFEDHEYAGIEAQSVQVAVELGQSFGQWVGVAFAPDLSSMVCRCQAGCRSAALS
jgi:hypothetical protein